MYDPSYFVEREQYIARVKEYVDENFEGTLHEVFSEVVGFYGDVVDFARAYESAVTEKEKQHYARKYEKAAKLLQKYLDVMKNTMDGTDDGVERLEQTFQHG